MKRLTVAGILILSLSVLYLGDYAWARYRAAHPKPNDPFESVEYYTATQLKSGKVEVFFDQPGTETCIHSLFPQQGDLPCWYVKRKSTIRVE